MESMWLSHFRSWEMVVPRNLNDSTAVTVLFMMVSGGRAGGFLLKSTIISTVLCVLSSRLLRLHSQLLNLRSVSRLVTALDEADQCGVVCKLQELQWSVEDLCGDGGQHRFSGRLVSHRLGLVPSFSCSFWRTCGCLLHLSAVQVWRRGGLQEVWMVFFQTCNKTHSDGLPVVDSPQCWGMVSCNWWWLSYLSTLKQYHWKRICSFVP